MKKSLFLLLFSISLFAVSHSQEKEMPEIGIYEQLDKYIPTNLEFYDIDSNLVKLSSLIDKPTVLSLVYFTCPGICSPLLDGLAEVIDWADIELGVDYQVFTISFNYSETPSLAKSKRFNYLKQIEKEVDEDAWKWFTGDSVNIYGLTDAVGFKFKREGKDFIHAGTLILLSPDGKVTRYLYGTKFNQFDLKMAVMEASEGKSSPTISKVLQYCFSYDADGKKYVFNVTKIGATVVILFAVIFFLILVLKRKKTEN
ncbi:MAG: SCO family protein [Bacteroidetes bacterium]|jgi:protein SCO1/2|nr:SCO family protein [Bacteroidota bacterium]MBT3422335.1 SCO family protein [Bacteroidota bacterium]MBT3934408.1 SCO family protein [Bacteroidota bacterium]MBT7825915.1 SCO family protein [Bacteroidota bacterium]